MPFTPKTTKFNLRINEDLKRKLELLAANYFMSTSSFAHLLLAWGADKFEKADNVSALDVPVKTKRPSFVEIESEVVAVRSAGLISRDKKTIAAGGRSKRK